MDQIDFDSLEEGLNKDLGIEYMELDPNKVVMKISIDTSHRQPLEYLHDGAGVVLAESAATVGAWLNCPPGKVALGSKINASHLRPKRSGILTTIGTPVQVGSTNQVWKVRIHDEDKKRVCVSRCGLVVVDMLRDDLA
ncbi:MAG: hotdog fold thioesterase [Rubrobacter sp.]|nr:hotdog fold thioesterase [Rubrobacter sp.]